MNDPYLQSMLGENEKILVVARRHWLVLAGEILAEAVLSVALIVLILLIWALWLPNPLVALGFLLLALPLVSMARDILIWYNAKFVVTDRRVIYLQGVINKNVTDSSLEKVNDVKMDQSVWGRLFGFGNVEILTASELPVNKFTNIANPVKFKTAMQNAKSRMGRQPYEGQAEPQAEAPPGSADDVPGLIAQLDVLRRHGVLSEEEFQAKKTQLLGRL